MVFIAEALNNRHNELLGMLEVSLRDYAEGCDTKPVGYLEGWYVKRSARRQSVGRKLVEAAEQWARQKGCKEMASDTPVWNRKSKQAHKSLGYKKEDVLVHFRKKLRKN